MFALDGLCRTVQAAWPQFRSLFQKMYGRDIFDREEDAPLEELTALLCGPKSGGIHDAIYDILSSRPMTVLHGDMRADNVFRTLGKGADDATLTFIDWQVIHAGPPGPEFTEAWMHSLEPEVRRADKDMLRQYHARLLELNPDAAAYTYEMLLEDYTLSFCFWWTVIIAVGVATLATFEQPEAARMKELWDRAGGRAKTAMVDLDCLSRIRALAANLPDDQPTPTK